MTTLTRSTPAYKDYVNFLDAYKNGRREENENSGDVPDFSKNSCVVPFNTYVENTKNKKFNTVKPNFEEKTVKKSEILIEIQPVKKVHEVSKIFENREKSPSPTKNVNSKINVFERQISKEKPKLANKPVLLNKSQLLKTESEIKPPTSPPISPPPDFANIPPPPPLPIINTKKSPVLVKKPPITHHHHVPKLQATLNKGPQIKHTVNNPNGVGSNGLDRNDPMVKKLVYGTLRGLYGAYYDKANDMMATLPKNRVKKSNGVQDIIEKIASSGDLDKLNGRVNPKMDQE